MYRVRERACVNLSPHMNMNAPRSHVEERMNLLTLGYFSPLDHTVHQFLPSMTGDSNALVTAAHEATHRDLAVSSDLGFFERLLGAFVTFRFPATQSVGSHRAKQLRSVLEESIRSSWHTHESAATYCSITQFFGENNAERASYLTSLPSDYRAAYDIYGKVFCGLSAVSIKFQLGRQLAKNVSRVALDIPVWNAFRSFDSVTPENAAVFFAHYSPDQRQLKLLERLAEPGCLERLMHGGEAFLRKHELAGQTTNYIHGLADVVKLWSELDMFFLSELRRSFPDLVLCDVRQQLQLRRELWESWREDWSAFGVEAEVDIYDPSENAEREVDSMLDASVEIGPAGDTFFGQIPFTSRTTQDVEDYVATLARHGSGLVVSVMPFASNQSVKLGHRTLPPKHLIMYTHAWQWGGDDRMNQIFAAIKSEPLMRPASILCAWQELAYVTAAIERVDTVWLRDYELEQIARGRFGYHMPPLKGWSLISRHRSSARDILDVCACLSSVGDVGAFVLAREKQSSIPDAEFVVLVEARHKVHLFPFAAHLHLHLFEMVHRLPRVRWWSRDEVSDSGLGEVLRDVVAIFFTKHTPGL